MAVTVTTLVEPQYAPNSTTTVYTAGATTQITKALVSNPSAAAANITIYKVPKGGSAGASHAVTPLQTVNVNQTWNCPDLTGAVLVAGDFIAVLASAASALVISFDGAQFT